MTDTNAGRNVGQALVALLREYGVDTIFGIPGVHNNELYRGLLNSGMHHILPRHRAGRGFHGGRLCPGDRQAGGVLHHHRAGPHQYHDAARPGLFRLRSHAGHLVRARRQGHGPGQGPAPRNDRPVRGGGHGDRHGGDGLCARRRARTGRARLCRVQCGAAAAGLYRNSNRCAECRGHRRLGAAARRAGDASGSASGGGSCGRS